MKLSICVTIRNRSKLEFNGNNIEVFPRSVQSMVNAVEKDEIELVVSDWGSTDWPIRDWIYDIVDNRFPVKVVDIDEEWFSRGRGLNVAAENATSDILFFTDADIIVTREVILEAYEKCSNNMAFYPVCRHESLDKWFTPGFGLCATTKEMWEAGKWKEWSSWGGEDDDFRNNIDKSGYEVYRRRYEGFLHIDHPRDYSVYKNEVGFDSKEKARKKLSIEVEEAKKIGRARTSSRKKQLTKEAQRKSLSRKRKVGRDLRRKIRKRK